MLETKDGAARGGARARANLTAGLVALAFLALALPQLGDYGPTLDCTLGEYPYGERLLGYLETGDEAFLDLGRRDPAPALRAPHPDFDVDRQVPRWAHPFAPLLSAVSCRLLWTELGRVPAMQAHHLVVPLFVALALFVLVRFAAARAGPLAGVLAAALLVSSPRFFAHAMSNLKDAPETALYFLAAVTGYAALRGSRRGAWAACGALAGLALAQKPNALFLPLHLSLFAGLALALQRRSGEREIRWSWTGLALAGLALPAAYVLVSPGVWTDPVGEGIEHLARHLRVGHPGRGENPLALPGMRHPDLIPTHGLSRFFWTTPLPVLLLAPLGLLESRLSRVARLFLALGVAVPLGRTLVPGMADFDGVRHFLELYPFLALLAGCGLAWVARALARRGRAGAVAAAGAVVLALAPGALATVRTSPNGICYHNALVGGLDGARARGLGDAYDYWGNSEWQGLRWIASDAPPGARVLTPVVGWVAAAAAPVVLPPGVATWKTGHPAPEGPLYVMCLATRSRSGPLQLRLDRTRAPEHEIRVQGATILTVHRLDRRGEVEAALRDWRAEGIARGAMKRVWFWLEEHPERLPALFGPLFTYDREGPTAAAAELETILPEPLREGLAEALWYQKSIHAPGPPERAP